jgi:thiosulfate reductase cytochrome b subunit
MADIPTSGSFAEGSRPVIHRAPLRILHWVNAIAILILIPSGLAIYNAAPFYSVVFPTWMTLGGGLTGALLWHFAAMWLLVINGIVYMVYRIALRAGGPALFPLSLGELLANLRQVLKLSLGHKDGIYNGIQKAFYLGIVVVLIVAVASGIAIWKPVQLQGLTEFLGGYEWARRVHFWAMAATVAFLFIHLAMVALVPRTFLMMLFGINAGVQSKAQNQKDTRNG